MLVVPAYAKVNLALEVTGRRPDSWHDIASVIATIDWHDLVGIRLLCDAPTPPAMSPAPAALHVSGSFAEGIPTGPDNLALRAATLLLEIAGPRAAGLRLDVMLVKQVPAAAGLGGGSADAAAVLRAGAGLLATRGAPIADADLAGAAATVGSDVPAVLAGGTVFATGRGEHLRPLPTPALHLTVAVAGASSTAAAYGALNDDERRATGRATQLAEALASSAGAPPRTPLDAALLGSALNAALLGSALEPAACRATPGLADALARLRALTPKHPWHLTGSGGAAFALTDTAQTAHRLATTVQAAGFAARACRTVPARLGPLPGTAPAAP